MGFPLSLHSVVISLWMLLGASCRGLTWICKYMCVTCLCVLHTHTHRVFSMLLQVQGSFRRWVTLKVINSELGCTEGSRKIPNLFPCCSLGSCWCCSCQICGHKMCCRTSIPAGFCQSSCLSSLPVPGGTSGSCWIRAAAGLKKSNFPAFLHPL